MKKVETYQDLEPGYRIRNDIRDEYLQSWIFYYNPYIEIWNAIPRDKYIEFWQGGTVEGVQRSNSLTTLLELLYKTGGDLDKLKNFVDR